MDSEISKQFEEFGCEVSPEILAKCIELCTTYRITDPVEFVEQWFAFSVSHLDGADPTIGHLNEMERKELIPKREKEIAASNKRKTKLSHSAHFAESNPLTIYGIDSPGAIDSPGKGGSVDTISDDIIMDSYICNTPKAKSKFARTPARQNDVLFSPASYSPISSATPSRSQTCSGGSGKIICTFGNPTLISTTTWSASSASSSSSSSNLPKITIKQILLHNGEPFKSARGKYMSDNLREKADVAGDRIFRIGQGLCCKVFGIDAEVYDLDNVDVHSQMPIKTIGVICCDYEGKLDATSTLLLGSDEMRCRTVRLNFSQAKSVGVFPGQIIMVSGMNPMGDVFVVHEIIAERILEPSPTPKLTESMSLVIAAGPFTHSDDLAYEPLHNLIAYCKNNMPDALILIGPFMDAEHTLIQENIVLAEPFDVFFEKIIGGIVEAIGSATTILFVACHKDANADPVFPTAPIAIKKSYPNVHMLPDPTIVDMNGLTIGMTAADVLDHIMEYELAANAGEKVKRIIGHLFHQGSFYPMNPPPLERINVDTVLANQYANIEKIPNVIILPSRQKSFIRVVNGCLAINPGQLADANGGSFARLVIEPPPDVENEEPKLFNCVACQVRKI